MPSLRNSLRRRLWSALALGLVPAALAGQSREVVSQEINVGKNAATLRLEFAQGAPLSVALEDGSITVDGESIGSYDRGDVLDTSWRALLGEAVSLADGALARRLRDWSPPGDLAPSERSAAQRLDRALEAALSATPASATTDAAAAVSPSGSGEMDRAMSALVGRPRRLLELSRAVEDLDLDQVQVHVGEDVTVADGETVHGSLVVVDGDLDLRGEVDGSVVMVGGGLHLEDGGRVTGDVRLSDARIFRDGGEVEGDVSNVRLEREEVDRDKIRAEIRKELRDEIRDKSDASFGPLPRITRAIGELVGSLLAVLVIGVLGGGLAVYFAHDRMEVVAEAARRAPVRAGMVGLAGAFLTLPAWVLGALGLIVTIVGILALPFWIVLFPVAVCVAAGVGYLAVAQSVGEWVARQRFSRLDWVRVANPYSTVVAGVGALTLWFVVSNLIQIVGFLGFVSVLLAVFGGMVTCAALLIGFGAVLLTRGGQQPAYADGASWWGDPWDDDPGHGSPMSGATSTTASEPAADTESGPVA